MSNAPLTESESVTLTVAVAPVVVSCGVPPSFCTTWSVLPGALAGPAKPTIVNDRATTLAPTVSMTMICWPAAKPAVRQSTPSVRVIAAVAPAVMSNVPATCSGELPPPCTVVRPPCEATRIVPLFASSAPGTSVLLIVNVSLPWPRSRLTISMVEVLPSVLKFPLASSVIVP